jgi:hypothetical protein
VSVIKVELIGFMVVFVEENNGFGSEVVDADYLSGLHGR